MKTKTLLIIALCGIVTVSFTSVSPKKGNAKKLRIEKITQHEEPLGGFLSEDKL